MLRVDSSGEVFNASQPDRVNNYNVPSLTEQVTRQNYANSYSSVKDYQRQRYGYSGADILREAVESPRGDKPGKSSVSGSQESFDLHAYRASMPRIRDLEDEEPGQRDKRSVRERTIGKSSIIQKEINLTKKSSETEKQRKKWKKLNERAELIRQKEKRIVKEHFNLKAAKQRGLEAIEVERRKHADASAQQQKLVDAALEERIAAERKANAATERLKKEKENTRKIIDDKNRSLQAERILMEAEVAEKLKLEMRNLKKAEAHRVAMFKQQQQEMVAALNAANTTAEKSEEKTTMPDAKTIRETNKKSITETGPGSAKSAGLMGASLEIKDRSHREERATVGTVSDTGGEESGVDADVTRSEMRMTSKSLQENVDVQNKKSSSRDKIRGRKSPSVSPTTKPINARDLLKEVNERTKKSKESKKSKTRLSHYCLQEPSLLHPRHKLGQIL